MNGAFITSLHRQQRYRRQILSTVKRRAHSSQQGCSLAKQYYVCADRVRQNPDLISVVCPSAKRAGRSSSLEVQFEHSSLWYGVDSPVQMCLVPWFGSGRLFEGGGGLRSKHHKNKLFNCNLFYIDYSSIIRNALQQLILFWSSLIRQLVP